MESPPPMPEGEPPPFRRDELPAFADGTQEETPVWTVNPETGEKVHEGPIELTFDGPLAPGRSGRPNARLIFAAGTGVIVVAALAVSFYMRSQAREIPAAPQDAADGAPAATTPDEVAPAETAAGPPASAGAPGAIGETAGSGTAAVAGDGGGAPPGEVEPPPPPPAVAHEVAAEPAAEQAPRPAAAAPDDERLAPGQARLDAGDVAGAASAFRDALAALPANRFSLQIMIACEEATVRKARAALSPDDPLFVTPFTMQGRPCHRLLWGIYLDRDAAQAGATTLPPYFTGAGISPVVVSIGRLRGPS
jgi:hypothetical protein